MWAVRSERKPFGEASVQSIAETGRLAVPQVAGASPMNGKEEIIRWLTISSPAIGDGFDTFSALSSALLWRFPHWRRASRRQKLPCEAALWIPKDYRFQRRPSCSVTRSVGFRRRESLRKMDFLNSHTCFPALILW